MLIVELDKPALCGICGRVTRHLARKIGKKVVDSWCSNCFTTQEPAELEHVVRRMQC